MTIPLEQNSVKLEHLRDQTAPKRLRLQLLSSQLFAALQNPKIPKKKRICVAASSNKSLYVANRS
jgi:hypothetical protein